MEHIATVTLWRRRPPFFRRVQVRSFTVGAWLRFVRKASTILAVHRLEATDKIDESWVTALALGEDEWSAIADIACPGERPGFFRPFFSAGKTLGLVNVRALISAMGDLRSSGVNDWERLWGSLNFEHNPDHLSAEASIDLICRRHRGMTPFTVYREQMTDFLDMRDGLLAARDTEDEAEKPKVASLEDLAAMPGYQVQRIH